MDMSEVLAVHSSLAVDRESVSPPPAGRMSKPPMPGQDYSTPAIGTPIPPSVGVDNGLDVRVAIDETVLFADTHAPQLRETSRALRVIRPPRPYFCQYALADKIRREYVAQRIRDAGEWK